MSLVIILLPMLHCSKSTRRLTTPPPPQIAGKFPSARPNPTKASVIRCPPWSCMFPLKLEEGDLSGVVRLACLDTVLAENNDDTLRLLNSNTTLYTRIPSYHQHLHHYSRTILFSLLQMRRLLEEFVLFQLALPGGADDLRPNILRI